MFACVRATVNAESNRDGVLRLRGSDAAPHAVPPTRSGGGSGRIGGDINVSVHSRVRKLVMGAERSRVYMSARVAQNACAMATELVRVCGLGVAGWGRCRTAASASQRRRRPGSSAASCRQPLPPPQHTHTHRHPRSPKDARGSGLAPLRSRPRGRGPRGGGPESWPWTSAMGRSWCSGTRAGRAERITCGL